MAFISTPGPMELLVIAAIALIVLGPKRLPMAARSLGRGIRELRESMSGFGDDDEEEEDDVPDLEDDAEARAEEEDRAALPPA